MAGVVNNCQFCKATIYDGDTAKTNCVECGKPGWDPLRQLRPKPEPRKANLHPQTRNKLNQVLDILRGEIAKTQIDISGCCGEKAGQRFCENYGCSCMQQKQNTLVTVLNTLVDIRDTLE
jgi:hypothetical protein